MQNKRDPELKLLTGFKSYTGIVGYVALLGLVIALIGIVCPFCSYNPTKLELTKRIIHFWDLSFFYIAFSIVLILTAFFLAEISKYFTNWRTRKKLYVIFPVLVFIFAVAAYALTTAACVFYEIPETDFSMLEIDFEAGFYLFTVGIFVFAIAFFVFCRLMVKIIDGKTQINSVLLIKDTEEK